MESIFESLENLNVSEECFEDIVGLVEEYLDEGREPGESLYDYKNRLDAEKYNRVLPGMEDREATEKSIARNLGKKQKGNVSSYKKSKKEFMNAQKVNYTNKGKYEQSKGTLDAIQKMYGVDHPVSDTVGYDHLGNAMDYAQSRTNLSRASQKNKEAKKLVDDTQKKIDMHSDKAQSIRNSMEKLHPGWTKYRSQDQQEKRGVKTKESKMPHRERRNMALLRNIFNHNVY